MLTAAICTTTYDDGGNILSKTEYAYTTGDLGTPLDTITYTYGDSTWKDLLTAYDGQPLTCDEIGNLTDDGTWEYTWQHGRQLAGMTDGTTAISFAYNADGRRVSKTVDGVTYNYASIAVGEVIAAMDHQDYPFGDLVKKRGLNTADRNPLFDVMFACQSEQMTDIMFDDEKAEWLQFPTYVEI